MEEATPARISLLGLLRGLTTDTRTLIRQEIQLAKTELTEKFSKLGRNAAILAIGAFVIHAGLLVFLIGLGWLGAWAFQAAGLPPLLAGFVGLAAVGLLILMTGSLLLFKGFRVIKSESLVPEKTQQTLNKLKSAVTENSPSPSAPVPALSSAELQERVEATEGRMGETLDELGRRLTPRYLNEQVKARIRKRPLGSGLLAMGMGLLSGLFLKRRFRHP